MGSSHWRLVFECTVPSFYDNTLSRERRLYMRLLTYLTLVIGISICSGLEGQVYLIAGTPSHNLPVAYASKLIQVDSEGHATPVKDLVSRENGIDWIVVRLDLRKALILTWNHYSAMVFDLDKLDVVKQCDLQVESELTLGQWLADVPGRGPAYQAWLSYPDGHPVFRSLALSPDVSCSEWSGREAGPEEIKYIVANGAGFNSFAQGSDGTYGKLDLDGNLTKQMGAGTQVDLGLRLPPGLPISEESRAFIGVPLS